MAQKLGMLVGDMRTRMSGQEWLEWVIYFSRQNQRRELEAAKLRGG